MALTVHILFASGSVAVSDNLKRVNRFDEVTWVSPTPEAFEVVFSEFEPLDGGTRQNIPPEGPFSSPLSTSGGPDGQRVTSTVEGNAAEGTYFYQIHLQGQALPLPWLNPISGTRNFGGVEVHGPPN